MYQTITWGAGRKLSERCLQVSQSKWAPGTGLAVPTSGACTDAQELIPSPTHSPAHLPCRQSHLTHCQGFHWPLLLPKAGQGQCWSSGHLHIMAMKLPLKHWWDAKCRWGRLRIATSSLIYQLAQESQTRPQTPLIADGKNMSLPLLLPLRYDLNLQRGRFKKGKTWSFSPPWLMQSCLWGLNVLQSSR